ncbi:ATP-grasp domain-containing protein [Candidatus Kaiserbacteria bacterium]|nr:ATP-grasp domain-containing protein [Candidatus Kaiserbacteria bacterium]
MARTIVGVLRGGTSSEYPLSLKTGAAVMAALPQEQYETRDILIDKGGTWHLRGMPSTPVHALMQVDVILNALHGGIGEDGTVQRILDRVGIPYAGSRALPAGISLNKIRAREALTAAKIPMPRAVAFSLHNRMDTREMADAVFAHFGPPYMVKPPAEGSSRGIRYVATIAALPEAIGDILDEFGAALIEEYLLGEHATIGVIENFRNEPLYALTPAHIDLPEGAWYYDPHAEGERARHLVPSRFSRELKEAIADVARKAHRVLSLAHFSDADFVVTRRGPYLLEMNANPHLYEDAAFPHMLEAVGSSLREFLEHSILLARKGI